MTVHYDQCPICSSKRLEPFLSVKDHWVSKEEFELLKCADCTLVLTQDVPDRDNIGKYYQHDSYISHTDTNQGLLFKVYHAVRNHMLGRKAKMVEKSTTKGKLLDIGAGTGYFLNTMKQRGWQTIGVEPDKDAAAIANKNFDVTLNASLDVLPANTKVDAISMWHVLEHVHDLNGYFKKFQSLLAPKGSIVIAVPNYTSHDAKAYGKYWAAYDIPKHLWHFSPKSMDALASKHGFNVVKKHQLPFDPFYISLLSAKNKGSGFLGKISAAFTGEFSYLKTLLNVDNASSVVYILKRKND